MHYKKKLWIIPAMLLMLSGCSLESSAAADQLGPDQSAAASQPGITVSALSANEQALLAEWANKIYPGTTIQGVDVSGLTRQQARDKVEKALMKPLAKREVRFRYANTKDYMSYYKLKVTIDEAIYEQALASGKSGSDKEKLAFIKNGLKLELKPSLTYDKEYLNRTVTAVARKVREYSREKLAKRVDGKVVLRKDASEAVLDQEAFRKALISAINFDPKHNKYIEAEVSQVPTTITQAELATITTKLTSFSTSYKNSADSRKYNIALAAEMISGTLVMPGSEYSFNRSIGGGAGKRNGFKTAGVYSGLELVEESGGGVCQVSSTMYNIVLNLGITPTQRVNHGMRVSYLPEGMDAMVYAPSLDLKFVNPFDTPIYITAKGNGEELRFTVYGAKNALGGYSYKYEQKVYNLNKAVIKEVKDSSIPKGAQVLDPTPKDGFKAKVYKLTYKNGKLVDRKLITDDEYERSDGKLRIGTGSGKQVAKDWYVDRVVKKYPPGWSGPRN